MKLQLSTWLLLTGLCGLLPVGCYKPDAVKPFLRQPQSPITGVEYRIYPPDILSINSSTVTEIHGVRQQVRPDGKINLPLFGEILCAGKTPQEVEEAIIERGKEFYEDLDVTVIVVAFNSQSYYVFGQVNQPGPKAWTGKNTLLDALAAAQPTNLAWMERIYLVRGDQPSEGGYGGDHTKPSRLKYRVTGIRSSTPQRPREEIIINLRAMTEKGDMSNNVLLRPNDVIYVQPHPLATVGLELQKILFPINPAINTVTVPARVVTGAAIP